MAVVLTEYKADVDNYRKNVQDATKDTVNFDKATTKAGKDSTKAYDSAGDAAGNLSKQTDNLSKQSKTLGDTFKQLGTRLVAAFAVQQVISRVTTTIIEFQSAMSELSAITGATGDDLEFLSDKAKELGRTTTVSAQDVVKGFQLIASARPELLKDGEALAFVTEQAITLAEAAGTDLEPAAIALTDALAQFNAPASEAGRFINVLAAAAQQGSVLIPDLTTSLGEFGTVARSSNVSVEQSAALVEILGERIKGASRVGIQLRNIFTILQGGADDTNPAVVGLNTAIANLGDQVEQGASLTKLFGRENQIAAQLLVENQDRLVELTDAVTGTDTALEQALVNTDNFAAGQERLSNSIDSFILSLEDGSGPLSRFAQQITDIGTSFFNALSQVNEGIEDTEDAVNILDSVLGTLGLDNEILGLTGVVDKLRIVSLDLATANKEELQQSLKDVKKFIEENSEEVATNTELYGILQNRIEVTKDRLAALSEEEAKNTSTTEEATDVIEKEIVTLGSLQKRLTELKAELKLTEIGGTEFNEIQQEILQLSGQIALAQGKETEATKKLREEREKRNKEELKALEESFKLFLELQKADDDRFKREQEAAVKTQELRAIGFDEQAEAIIAARDLELSNQNLTENERILIKEQANKKILDLNKERIDKEDEDNDAQAEKDKQRRQEVFDATVSSLNAIADFAGTIGEIQTDKELTELDKRREQALESESLTEEQRQEIEEAFEKERSEILRQQAVKDKQLAVFQATINGAAAVIAQLSVPGAGPALAIAAGVAAALQLAAIVATPIPQFHTGGIDIGNKDDEFTALLKRGESVITPDKTKMYRPELQAIMDGTLDQHIYNNYVLPQISKIALDNKDNENKSFASNMAQSLHVKAISQESTVMKEYIKRTYLFYKHMEAEMNKPQPKKHYYGG